MLAIMQGTKKLAGLAAFNSGAANHLWLRFTLSLYSLIGLVSSSLHSGNQIDPDSVTHVIPHLIDNRIVRGPLPRAVP